MKVLHGDLLHLALEGVFDVIVHGCNCQCVMGKGIALSIKERFAEAYAADCATPKGDPAKLGTISFAWIRRGDAHFRVVNAYTQLHWRGPEARVSYDAVRACMGEIKSTFPGLRIGYPRIGAGLGGGDWKKISEIIREELSGEDHTLVEFAPSRTPAGPRERTPEPKQAKFRKFKYTYLYPVADSRGNSSCRKTGDLTDLLRDAYPYEFGGSLLPPLRIANALFDTGLNDMGMSAGAEWEPFALTQAEYDDFLAYLDTDVGKRKFARRSKVIVAQPPDDLAIEHYGDWKIRELMKDPSHHFNTTRVWTVIDGKRIEMTMGESLRGHPRSTFQVIRDAE